MKIFLKSEGAISQVESAELEFSGLVCCGRVIRSETDLYENAVVQYQAKLLGGGKKRKKKVYTTPKKIKHKHKKVPLKTLQYYKIDEDGKITRLRKLSPSAPGCFLAKHKDRMTCGKTGTCYFLKDDN